MHSKCDLPDANTSPPVVLAALLVAVLPMMAVPVAAPPVEKRASAAGKAASAAREAKSARLGRPIVEEGGDEILGTLISHHIFFSFADSLRRHCRKLAKYFLPKTFNFLSNSCPLELRSAFVSVKAHPSMFPQPDMHAFLHETHF